MFTNFVRSIVLKGEQKIPLDLESCNFTSYSCIENILGAMRVAGISKKQAPFWSLAMREFFDQCNKLHISHEVTALFIRKFDSNAGSKQNLGQTTASFKELF